MQKQFHKNAKIQKYLRNPAQFHKNNAKTDHRVTRNLGNFFLFLGKRETFGFKIHLYRVIRTGSSLFPKNKKKVS